MELNKTSKVSDLIELFNEGKIKYKDVQNMFNCSRDVIQSRLKNIGLRWDNTAKKMVGEPTAKDLDVPLVKLFEKQRRKQPPKVKEVNNPTSKQAINPNNKQESKQDGKPTSKPTMKKVTYEIEEQLHDQLRIKAIVEKRNVSEIVNEILKSGLKNSTR